MGKMTDKRKKMIRGAAVFVVFAAIVVAVRAIKKKRRSRISYEPMHERDRQRIDYLNSKIWQCDVTCRNMLRFERAPFFHLCDILRDRKLLADSVHVSVEQQVAMFLHIVGHNVRNRVVATNFGRSFWTISIYFRRVLHAIERSQLKGNSKITPISSWTCPPHLPVRVHGDALISTPAPRRCSPLPPLISADLRRPLGQRWLGHPSPSSGRSAGPGSAATRRPPPAATRPGSAAARRPPPAAACPGSAARRGSVALPDRSPPLEVEAEVKEKKSTN